jgi:hypothetical protein
MVLDLSQGHVLKKRLFCLRKDDKVIKLNRERGAYGQENRSEYDSEGGPGTVSGDGEGLSKI